MQQHHVGYSIVETNAKRETYACVSHHVGVQDQRVFNETTFFLEAGQSASENSERFHAFCEYARLDKWHLLRDNCNPQPAQ